MLELLLHYFPKSSAWSADIEYQRVLCVCLCVYVCVFMCVVRLCVLCACVCVFVCVCMCVVCLCVCVCVYVNMLARLTIGHNVRMNT